MSNIAYADFGAARASVENKVAELEEGYARLSNTLLEAYAGADITKRQFKVLLAILRKIYGWNKPMDRITDSQIAEITKLPVKRCNEAKLELVRMGLIRQQGGMFGPNKNIDEWCIPQIEGVSPEMRDKTSLKLRESNPSKQGDTKDTITKDNKHNNPLISPRGETKKFDPLSIPVPDWLNPDSWAEWVHYRSQIKKTVRTALTVTKAFRLLKECFDEGHDPSDVINTSIANGYQGLFKPRGAPRTRQTVEASPHWNSREGWEDFL